MIDSTSIQLGKVSQFGNPWHGRFSGAGLHLANGTVKQFSCPANAPETWLVRFAGIPAPATPQEQADAGMQWMADAVLYTCEKRYSPGSSQGLGYLSWLWRSPPGEVWRLRLHFIPATYSVAQDADSTMEVVVYAGRFGLIGSRERHDEVEIYRTVLAWRNVGIGDGVVIPALDHSPDGSKTSIMLRTGPTIFFEAPVAGRFEHREAILAARIGCALFEIEVAWPESGALPAVTHRTVVDSEQARTMSSSTSPAGDVWAQRTVMEDAEGRYLRGVAKDNTVDVLDHLLGAAYTPAGALRVARFRQSATVLAVGTGGMRLPAYSGSAIYDVSDGTDGCAIGEGVIYDWSYSAPAFTQTASFGYQSTLLCELLLDGVTVDSLTFEGLDVLEYSVSGNAVSWSYPVACSSRLDEFDTPTQEVTFGSNINRREIRIDGVLVAAHYQPGDDIYALPFGRATPIDPVRGRWASVRGCAPSNNVFCLLPTSLSAIGDLEAWAEKAVAVTGQSAGIGNPARVAKHGAPFAASFNPRDGDMALAVAGASSFV